MAVPVRAAFPPPGPDTLVLFDGTDRSAFHGGGGLVMTNGVLRGSGELRSKEAFANYELRIRFRLLEKYAGLQINGALLDLAGEAEPLQDLVGKWQERHITWRAMPGEQTRLADPWRGLEIIGRGDQRFSDRNVWPATEIPRDRRGWIAGNGQTLLIRFNAPVEVAYLSLTPLVMESAREFLALEGEALSTFVGKGKQVYTTYCTPCHLDGTGPALAPIMRSFALDKLENGSDRISLYETLTHGYKTMVPVPQLSAEERHQVAAYLSEGLLKKYNPSQYKPIAPEQIEQLPFALYTAQEEFDRRNRPADVIRQERGTFRDHGPAVVSFFGGDYRNAINIRLDEDTAITYDLYTLNPVNVRRDGFLDMMGSQYFKQRPSSITLPAGRPVPGLGQWVWGHHGIVTPSPRGLRGTPGEYNVSFKGYYLHNRNVILSYTLQNRAVLEMPSVVQCGETKVLLQQLKIGSGDTGLQLAMLPVAAGFKPQPPAAAQVLADAGVKISTRVLGPASGLHWSVVSGYLVLNIPASAAPIEFAIARAPGNAIAALAELEVPPALDSCTGGGERRWPTTYTRPAKVAAYKAAYVMDTLPVPYENEYNAWMRTVALDFFPDGRAVVTTYAGDVWMVSGIDEDLKAVTWSRFAAGLYQGFGVKVVDGKIHVTTRNGIVRLHDLNRDGEADYYEQFFTDPEVSNNWHGYNFDLIRDRDGYFYYSKNGQFTDTRMEGGVLKVSPDGKSYREFATGFRTPNGMGLMADGRITFGENQGGYVPAGKISIVKEGKWYGGATRKSAKETAARVFEPPFLWLPQDVDNSCGGQLWISDKRFGPYADRMMHTSCGQATAMMLFLDEFGDTLQGAAQPFPFHFDSGVMRLATNPQDGQVYLTGTRGWQIHADWDGCLQRIRYTGTDEPLLMQVRARNGGIELGFNQPLQADALLAEQFSVSAWNYKWTSSYGSKDYKPGAPREPGVVGRDTWPVRGLSVSQDGKRLWIEVPDIMPADQVRVDYQVAFASGANIKNTVHLTIHALVEK